MKKDVRVAYSIGLMEGAIWVLGNVAYSMAGAMDTLRAEFGSFNMARDYMQTMMEDTVYVNSPKEMEALEIIGVLVVDNDVLIRKVK